MQDFSRQLSAQHFPLDIRDDRRVWKCHTSGI
jgi:hypothetical protein